MYNLNIPLKMKFVKNIELGDPSSNKQNFMEVKLKLLCCRYWHLDLWDCHDMIFPFWRIYWNRNEGGELRLQEDVYKMTPDYLYIISPFTSFSTRFSKNLTISSQHAGTQGHQSQLDFISTESFTRKEIKDVEDGCFIDLGSDHACVKAEIDFEQKLKKNRKVCCLNYWLE